MKNEYEVRGDVTAIIINSKKYGRKEAIINTNKLEKADMFTGTWFVTWCERSSTFYVHGNTPMINGKSGKACLHRLVTDAPSGMVVDHYDHNGLNNTSENLRVVTIAENNQNLKGASRNNKSSGIRGVSWHKRYKKWRAQVRLNNKLNHLGDYKEISEAEKAVKEFRSRYMPYSVEL